MTSMTEGLGDVVGTHTGSNTTDSVHLRPISIGKQQEIAQQYNTGDVSGMKITAGHRPKSEQ